MEQVKWLTELEIVDIATGEIITKSEYERYNYYKVRTERSSQILEYYHGGYLKKSGRIRIQWHVRKSGQTELF